MIVFVTAYDEATKANLSVGKPLAEDHRHVLLEEQATKKNLIALLEKYPYEPLFAMSHGSEQAEFYGHDGHKRELAINIDDVELFKNRKSYVYACHTGAEGNLGSNVSKKGGTWWGYSSRVTAPSSVKCICEKQEKLFSFIQNEFENKHDENEIKEMLNELKTRCEEVDKCVEQECPENITLEVIMSIKNIWQYLCVWHPSSGKAIKHDDAYDKPLIGL